MELVLAIDFGSTFTKVVAFDLEREAVVGTSKAVSTVGTDVTLGLRRALDQLTIDGKPVSSLGETKRLACSSAAGGLKVVVVGLVPSLSVEAARRAALGAGAKIIGSYGFKLTNSDIRQISTDSCDLLLLAGGTDGGDEDTILFNARMLAKSSIYTSFVVAGNRVVGEEVHQILERAGRFVVLTENILPDLETLNIQPVHNVIRDIFARHIVKAKGIDKAEKYLQGDIIPTPNAVLKAAKLLAEGTAEEPGTGELVVIDIGGSTTDVHSVAKGDVTLPGVIMKGLPEPLAKRTVEGDLGLRSNARTLLEKVGEPKVKRVIHSMKPDFDSDIAAFTEMLSADIGFVPTSEDDFAVDNALGMVAAELAMERHAGWIEEKATPLGSVQIQRGKDLTHVRSLIGVGGVLAYGSNPRTVLQASLFSDNNPPSLKPRNPTLYIDRKYVLYGIGLLSEFAPTQALRIAKKELLRI